jgi:hypothetical protein
MSNCIVYYFCIILFLKSLHDYKQHQHSPQDRCVKNTPSQTQEWYHNPPIPLLHHLHHLYNNQPHKPRNQTPNQRLRTQSLHPTNTLLRRIRSSRRLRTPSRPSTSSCRATTSTSTAGTRSRRRASRRIRSRARGLSRTQVRGREGRERGESCHGFVAGWRTGGALET